MKFQINFDTKVIKVEDNVNLGELVEKLQTMLPEWKTWKLETNVTINWTSPVTIVKEKQYPWNHLYWTNDLVYRGNTTSPLFPLSVTCSTSNTTNQLPKNTVLSYTGTHNVEI